ncbi:MAG: pyridoxal-phosphate dependent enzyme [Acidilobaceae archaeon]
MKLIPIDKLRYDRELSIWDVLDVIGSIIRDRSVRVCIEVDESYVIKRGLEIYWALRRIGASKAPVGFGECYATLDDIGFYDNITGDTHRVYSSSLDFALRGLPTPLVKLRSYSDGKVNVWAKLEWYNPFSLSIKDRPAVNIVSSIASSRREGIIGDVSSANFGIALTAVALQFNIKTRVYLPRRAEEFGLVVPSLMGADVIHTDAELTVDIISRVKSEAVELGFIHVDQFTNDLNFEAHLKTLAKEIDYQALKANLKLVGIAGSIGTSGHMSALNFYFKNRYGDEFKVILAQPARGEHIPGIRRSETGMIWLAMIARGYEIFDVTLGEAIDAVKRVASKDGLLIGPSGGATLVALEKYISKSSIEGDIVAIIPDTGYKYLRLLKEKL